MSVKLNVKGQTCSTPARRSGRRRRNSIDISTAYGTQKASAEKSSNHNSNTNDNNNNDPDNSSNDHDNNSSKNDNNNNNNDHGNSIEAFTRRMKTTKPKKTMKIPPPQS